MIDQERLTLASFRKEARHRVHELNAETLEKSKWWGVAMLPAEIDLEVFQGQVFLTVRGGSEGPSTVALFPWQGPPFIAELREAFADAARPAEDRRTPKDHPTL